MCQMINSPRFKVFRYSTKILSFSSVRFVWKWGYFLSFDTLVRSFQFMKGISFFFWDFRSECKRKKMKGEKEKETLCHIPFQIEQKFCFSKCTIQLYIMFCFVYQYGLIFIMCSIERENSFYIVVLMFLKILKNISLIFWMWKIKYENCNELTKDSNKWSKNTKRSKNFFESIKIKLEIIIN